MTENRFYNIETFEHEELTAKDNGEKLSLSAVLSSTCDFEDLFVTHEILSPGRKDSSPHYHSKKEEMIFVLHGNPTLHIGDGSIELNPGAFVGIKPSLEHHYITNETNSEVRFLKICSKPSSDETTFAPSDSV